MPLQPLAIGKPGSGGLNTQEPVPLVEDSLVFASVARNAIIGTTGLLEAREDFVNQTSGFSSGTAKVVYIHTALDNSQTFISAVAGKLYTGKTTLTQMLDYRAGKQMIDVGGAKTGASATGLSNSGTTYGFSCVIDGVTKHVSVVGSAAQTYTTLISEINVDLGAAGTAALVAGNIEITSATTGGSSSVATTDGPDTASTALFATLTNFRAICSAEAGTTGSENWQFASVNGKLVAAQAGRRPRAWSESDFTTEIAITYPASGAFKQPNVVMAGWGRFWFADDSAGGNQRSLWWTDLLTTAFTGGDSGTINLTNVWPDGSDRIKGLGQFSNRLVIFGRNNVVMYQLAADLNMANMTLLEPIRGVGCVARDSVINTGTDLMFLNDQGVMSLQRLTTVASLPTLSNYTKNVQDDILAAIAAETDTLIRAGYAPRKGWYMISFPTSNKTYCLNLLSKLTDGTPRVTTWDNTGMPFYSFVVDNTGALYTGGTNGIYKYSGYTSDGASQAFTFEFWTPWLVFGDETVLKLLKWVEMTVYTKKSKNVTLSWRTDYVEGTTRTLAFVTDTTEFAEDPGVGKLKLHVGGAATAVKFGISFVVSSQMVMYTMRALAGKGKVV